MFELIIMLSRYVFIFYIAFFLLNGFVFILDEHGTEISAAKSAVSAQRIIIVIMHLTAFLILSYKKGEFAFDFDILLLGAKGLGFIIFFLLTSTLVYKKSCPLIWNGMLFLLDLSLIMLSRLNMELASKQIVWIAMGYTIMLIVPFMLKLVPQFEMFEWLYIIIGFLLIFFTIFFGKEEYGSLNWIKIGSFGFQPSEIVKFLYIFYLACVFRKKLELKDLIISSSLCGGIVLLLVYQRDLGGALIFFMTFMIMFYIATSNSFLFLGGIGAFSIASVVAYYMYSHVRTRVTAWINPWSDIDYGGYQIVQSLFAMSTWGIFGSGLKNGMPYKIPVVEKDFIFAAIFEEFGLLFAIGVICVYIMIFLRGIIIALNCKRRFYSLIASGITVMFAFQAFLIIGGVIKFIPLTGVTLPFVSYGGSSVLVSIIMIGLIQWIGCYYEKRGPKDGDAFE